MRKYYNELYETSTFWSKWLSINNLVCFNSLIFVLCLSSTSQHLAHTLYMIDSQSAFHRINKWQNLRYKKEKTFKGRKKAEKGDYQQRMHYFRQDYPLKGNERAFRADYLSADQVILG